MRVSFFPHKGGKAHDITDVRLAVDAALTVNRLGQHPCQPTAVMLDHCNEHQNHNQLLLTPLRESIVDKPPYISGTLQIPDSFLSLFYTVAREGNAARFEEGESPQIYFQNLLTFSRV